MDALSLKLRNVLLSFYSYRRVLLTKLALLVTAGLLVSHTPAQALVTIGTLYNFGSITHDGTALQGNVVQGSDGNFYGTSSQGGTTASSTSLGYGTVFKITPTGSMTVLHNFADGSITNDGQHPTSGLVQGSDGNFYGTTLQGGNTNGTVSFGTIFKITPTGTTTILYRFRSDSLRFHDGINPSAGLVRGSDGNFYGTTQFGGSTGNGTVFKITPAGLITFLHTFGDGSVANDGNTPYASLVQGTDGNFYGTTQYGGSANGGTVFKMTPTGAVTILHHFHDGSVTNDGKNPLANLVQATDGNFYGTTQQGGSSGSSPGSGTVFKITSGGTLTILHNFGDGTVTNDGSAPYAGLIQGTDGNFYGTTYGGGSASKGTFFKMTSSGTETIIHHFGDGSVSNDGNYPEANLVQGTDGNFYGTTLLGGSAGYGTVFRTKPPYVTLHNFRDNSVVNDGAVPDARLIQTSDGSFYGTTIAGGAYGYAGWSTGGGTVFKITPSGTVVILHSFGGTTSDGNSPAAGLIQGTDGNFYGTTESGGSPNHGTIFKITPTGTETILHNFADGTITNDGKVPSGELVQGTDGNFYGTTGYGGGSADGGTIFKITPTGTMTILYRFTGGSDGSQPFTALTLGTDGNFYGTAALGGANKSGTLFKITPTGTFTLLHTFSNTTSDGAYPDGALIRAADGNFYGTTVAGGTTTIVGSYEGDGVAFKITPTGTYTLLHNFGDGSVTNDGIMPNGALVQARDSSGTTYFYGATQSDLSSGQNHGHGTIFKMSATGTVTIMHHFGTTPNDGTDPFAGLLLGSDGYLYGVASYGGTTAARDGNLGEGTVFGILP